MVTLALRSCVARQEPYIPGALSILPGTVPGRVRGSGHIVPTYFRRELRDRALQRRRGFALFVFGRQVHYSAAPRHPPRKRGIQSAAALRFYRKCSGILDHPLELVIGRRVAPTRWRVMTAKRNATSHVFSPIKARTPRQRACGARWVEP